MKNFFKNFLKNKNLDKEYSEFILPKIKFIVAVTAPVFFNMFELFLETILIISKLIIKLF